jgi:hypothetical protein
LLSIFSSVLVKMSFPSLRTLHFYAKEGKADIFAFSYALRRTNVLSALEEITFNQCDWEVGAFPMFLHAFAQGACPRLHSFDYLSLPVANDDYDAEEDQYTVNEEEARHYMKALTEMLEQRQALGTCVGMKRFGGAWLRHGPMALRERILRAALPTLQEMPNHGKWPEALPEMFVQIGAPCLLELEVQDTQLLRAIATRPGALGGLLELRIKFFLNAHI